MIKVWLVERIVESKQMQISNTHIICPRWCDKEVSFRTELQRTNCVIWRTLYFQVFHWVIQRSNAEAIRRRSRGTKTKSWRGTSKSCVRWAKHFLTIETVFRRDLYLYCFSKELIETVECQFQTRCFRLLIYTELVKTASCRFDYKMAPFVRCIIYRSWLWTLTGKVAASILSPSSNLHSMKTKSVYRLSFPTSVCGVV